MSKKTFGWILGLATLVIGVGAWVKIPKLSGPMPAAGASKNQLPTVRGLNLNRVEMEFPRDLGGRYNIVFVAFQQWHQQQVNTWVPFAQQTEREAESVRYYEFPTVWEMTAMRRTFLNEGMRAGIPDELSRERTITLYLDKAAFREQLDMPDEQQMYTLLMTDAGEIVWRSTGEFSAEKGTQILQIINEESTQ